MKQSPQCGGTAQHNVPVLLSLLPLLYRNEQCSQRPQLVTAVGAGGVCGATTTSPSPLLKIFIAYFSSLQFSSAVKCCACSSICLSLLLPFQTAKTLRDCTPGHLCNCENK